MASCSDPVGGGHWLGRCLSVASVGWGGRGGVGGLGCHRQVHSTAALAVCFGFGGRGGVTGAFVLSALSRGDRFDHGEGRG